MTNYKDETEVVTSIRIKRWKLKALQDVAAAEHRSMAGELRLLIDNRIKEAA